MKYIGNSSPCWTIQQPFQIISEKAKQILNEKHETFINIGPGKYSLEKEFKILKKNKSAFAFNISKRFPEVIPCVEITPLEKLKSTPKVSKIAFKSIIKNENQQKQEKLYNSFNSGTGQHFFSLSLRGEPSRNTMYVPGPGSYEVAKDLINNFGNKYNFGYRSQDLAQMTLMDTNLGPGSYNPTYNEFVRGVKITKSVASKNKSINLEQKSQSSEKKQISQTGEPKFVEKQQNRTFSQAPKNQFYKKLLKNSTPGPGSYNLCEINPSTFGNWKAKAYSLASKLPNLNERSTHLISPTAYTINQDLYKGHEGYSFPKARELSKIEVKSEEKFFAKKNEKDSGLTKFHKIRGGDFGNAKKNVFEKQCMPGPGAYNPNLSKVQQCQPSFSICAKIYSKKFSFFDENEGIQSPELNPNLKSILARPKLGKFGLQKKQTCEIKTMQKDTGENRFYTGHSEIVRGGYSFSTAKKFTKDLENNVEIGPGFYNLKNTIPQTQPWLKLENKY